MNDVLKINEYVKAMFDIEFHSSIDPGEDLRCTLGMTEDEFYSKNNKILLEKAISIYYDHLNINVL